MKRITTLVLLLIISFFITGTVYAIENAEDNFKVEYFENNHLKYSWELYDDNDVLTEITHNTTIKFDESENENTIMSLLISDLDIKEKTMVITFEHHGELNGKAKVSLYVGDKFSPGTKLNMFYYNSDKTELEKVYEEYEIVVDKDGYIEIEITHCSEYVLATNDVRKVELEDLIPGVIKPNEPGDNNFYYYIAGGVILVVVGGVISMKIIKKRRGVI